MSLEVSGINGFRKKKLPLQADRLSTMILLSSGDWLLTSGVAYHAESKRVIEKRLDKRNPGDCHPI